MPTINGKFRANPNQTKMHGGTKPAAVPKENSKAGAGPVPGSEKNTSEDGAEQPSELHSHGDGTYHTVVKGEQTEHPSIEHATAHMASKHEPEGDHVHMHHDGMGGVKSSHVKEGGAVEGPNEHGSPEEAGQHAASVMGSSGDESMPADSGGGMDMGSSMMRKMMGG